MATDSTALPCVRCGDPAVAVWKACADARFRVLCPACDLEANAWLLRFLKVTRPTWRLNRYKASMDLRPVTADRLKTAGMLPL